MSPSVPYFKEMNGQAESFLGIVMNMARAVLISGLIDVSWPLAVQHAMHL